MDQHACKISVGGKGLLSMMLKSRLFVVVVVVAVAVAVSFVRDVGSLRETDEDDPRPNSFNKEQQVVRHTMGPQASKHRFM